MQGEPLARLAPIGRLWCGEASSMKFKFLKISKGYKIHSCIVTNLAKAYWP